MANSEPESPCCFQGKASCCQDTSPRPLPESDPCKMIRNLKVRIQNMNILSHHAEYIFQVNRMPLFFLLIIKYSSKVCLVEKKKFAW